MERGQFTFYRSYWEALQNLPKRDRLAAYEAIAAYALDEVEPSLTGAAATAFILIRPTLDTGRKRAISGLAGGRKQTGSKTEANEKPEAREKEKEKEIEKEIE